MSWKPETMGGLVGEKKPHDFPPSLIWMERYHGLI